MHKVLIALLAMCLLLGGCSTGKDTPETSPLPENKKSIGIFVISDDIIQVNSNPQLQMAGLVTDTASSGNYEEQFADSQQKLGVSPQHGEVTFSFSAEVPQKITCYVNDYNGLAPSLEYTVDSPTAETTLYIDPIEVPSPSSSVTLHSNRQVHIICQYSDRTVEYFLVLEGMSTVTLT